ncbi:MAG: hypothetical protein IPH89_04410 [Bacteroidetes bacterium]|nr:hypothetical protein [Bacteroidota bacterium]
MKTSFKELLNNLKKVCNKYDLENEQLKKQLLNELKIAKLPTTNLLIDYQNVLLFIVAHPSNQLLLEAAEEELTRLSLNLKRMSKTDLLKLDNTGLPYTKSLSTFTHDLLNWYKADEDVLLKIDSFYNATVSLNDALALTVPS